MFLHSLRADRFGRHRNLEIDHLSDGLQVVYGPAGAGKRTLLRFLRAMLFGFDADTRTHFLPADSRGFGGSLTLHTSTGLKTISRFDDGGVEGRFPDTSADMVDDLVAENRAQPNAKLDSTVESTVTDTA